MFLKLGVRGWDQAPSLRLDKTSLPVLENREFPHGFPNYSRFSGTERRDRRVTTVDQGAQPLLRQNMWMGHTYGDFEKFGQKIVTSHDGRCQQRETLLTQSDFPTMIACAKLVNKHVTRGQAVAVICRRLRTAYYLMSRPISTAAVGPMQIR